jgi:hypothetical protein
MSIGTVVDAGYASPALSAALWEVLFADGNTTRARRPDAIAQAGLAFRFDTAIACHLRG